jgi:glycosyltransferase involved in cell wall biosynthesis
MSAHNVPFANLETPAQGADHHVERVGEARRLYYLCFQVTREGQASHAHVNEILRGLERQGWRTALFEPNHAGGRKTPLWRKVLSSFGPQWRLWKTKPAPDILYYRSHPAAILSIIWARLHGIPVVGEVNGTFADLTLVYPRLWPLAPLVYGVAWACFRLTSALITVTGPLGAWLQSKAGRTPVYVVANAANAELFRPDAQRDCPLADPYIVFVGAMSPWQGIDTLLEAVERPEWPDRVKLLFVGDGVERPAVECAAGRNARVLYWGHKPHRSIPGIVAASLAAVSTQNRKRGNCAQYGFSAMKVYEAMACGAPLIVTDFPGQGDVVREANAGFVVAPEDAEGIAKAVASLYSNPQAAREMGQSGRRTVEQFHTWQHRADRLQRILLGILGARKERNGGANGAGAAGGLP